MALFCTAVYVFLFHRHLKDFRIFIYLMYQRILLSVALEKYYRL